MDDPFERAVERERDERRERRHRAARAGFRWHARAYLAVNAVLVLIWLSIWLQRDGAYPWFVYPLIGWGIGLAVHYSAVRPAFRSRRRAADEPEARA
jgi:hypothetical protein